MILQSVRGGSSSRRPACLLLRGRGKPMSFIVISHPLRRRSVFIRLTCPRLVRSSDEPLYLPLPLGAPAVVGVGAQTCCGGAPPGGLTYFYALPSYGLMLSMHSYTALHCNTTPLSHTPSAKTTPRSYTETYTTAARRVVNHLPAHALATTVTDSYPSPLLLPLHTRIYFILSPLCLALHGSALRTFFTLVGVSPFFISLSVLCPYIFVSSCIIHLLEWGVYI
jgi:hypothetical protein